MIESAGYDRSWGFIITPYGITMEPREMAAAQTAPFARHQHFGQGMNDDIYNYRPFSTDDPDWDGGDCLGT